MADFANYSDIGVCKLFIKGLNFAANQFATFLKLANYKNFDKLPFFIKANIIRNASEIRLKKAFKLFFLQSDIVFF